MWHLMLDKVDTFWIDPMGKSLVFLLIFFLSYVWNGEKWFILSLQMCKSS